ncbi:hypothetical protein P9112_003476 [Eukaryota sp. TZLM1-RC]
MLTPSVSTRHQRGYHSSTKSKISTPIETHPVILSARRRWERHVVAALEDLRRESKLPLVDSVTSSSVDFMSLRYVWEPEELFSVLQSLKSQSITYFWCILSMPDLCLSSDINFFTLYCHLLRRMIYFNWCLFLPNCEID